MSNTRRQTGSRTSRRWYHGTRLERAGKRQAVYDVIHKLNGLRVENILKEADDVGVAHEELKTILSELKQRGLIYSPKPGFVCCVDE